MVDSQPWDEPATKWDVAMVAAQTSLAIHEIISTILTIQRGDQKATDEKVKDLAARADEIWTVYKKLCGGE
jgi:hypothetical protein